MSGDFKWRHFRGEIILGAARWYCKYGISYRDLEEMMGERGVKVDHSTLFRWVQGYAPEIERRLRWAWRKACWRGSWRVDETYVKVKGRWTYLYRAVTSAGDTVDFYLSATRNAKAPTYAIAIRELKGEGKCPSDPEHRQVKYLNNVIEADHGKLKRLIKPTLGFKSLRTAYATIKGFEVMLALRKNQARPWCLQPGATGEIRLIERSFNLGPGVIAELVEHLDTQMIGQAA